MRRYINVVGDGDREFFRLTHDGDIVATMYRRTVHPPQILTEGLPFEAQYDCHENSVEGEPCGWAFHDPDPVTVRHDRRMRVAMILWVLLVPPAVVYRPLGAIPFLLVGAYLVVADLAHNRRTFARV